MTGSVASVLSPNRPALAASPFLTAARGGVPSRTPVWFMRQAGRSLPEYRAIRERVGFHEMITNPELAAEVTLQPVRRHGVDAAVFFSDIITPIQAVVSGVTVESGRGPVIENPFRTEADLERLRPLIPHQDVPYVAEAIRRCCDELDPQGIPVIGFAGAPFTLATYLIEGGKSKEFAHTKSLMYGEPQIFNALMDRLADYAIASLSAQVAAGASAVQLFDSWAGILNEADYRNFVLPHSQKVFAAIRALYVPRIHFGVGTGELLTAMADAGPDVIGVDWRVSMTSARARVPVGIGLQGNLDPVVLLAPWSVIEAKVQTLLHEGRSLGPDWIFNLGHGVLPEIDPTVITRVVELVHQS
jgi:uroporphyrinogen decarboxylase